MEYQEENGRKQSLGGASLDFYNQIISNEDKMEIGNEENIIARKVQNRQKNETVAEEMQVDPSQFEDIENASFEQRLQKESEMMRGLVRGRTSMNILKITKDYNKGLSFEKGDNDEELSDDSQAEDERRMTVESYITTMMTIRNLSGESVMIPASEVSDRNLGLSPFAQPFYDENNNAFYELSMTTRPVKKGGKLVFYATQKVSQETVDKLSAPVPSSADGVAPEITNALNICDKLSKSLGVKLDVSDNTNIFMPSRIGTTSSSAKGILSKISFNKWQSKKFVPVSGTLHMDTRGMNGTEIITSYISRCALMSFDTNIETFLRLVENDRGYLVLPLEDKQKLLADYDKNFETIKYRLHAICTELISSEVVKMLPDTPAEERLAMSEAFTISAIQRMNELGKYINDPYVMKFIATTVTNSVSKYNSNFKYTANEIVNANRTVCGYRNLFSEANREGALFGEYDVFSNKEFEYSAFPTITAEQVKQGEENVVQAQDSKLEGETSKSNNASIIDPAKDGSESKVEDKDKTDLDQSKDGEKNGKTRNTSLDDFFKSEPEFSNRIIKVNEAGSEFPNRIIKINRDMPRVTPVHVAEGVDPDIQLFRRTVVGQKSNEEIEKLIAKYLSDCTKKALAEKSLTDKRRAVNFEGKSELAEIKVQRISSSQNAVTTLYNNAHTPATAKEADKVIEMASSSSDNINVIESTTIGKIETLATDEVKNIMKFFKENKEKYPDWKNAKTTASFVNFYYKNVKQGEGKYGVYYKNLVKRTCREMDASIAIDAKLNFDNVPHRMIDANTFIERNESEDTNDLNSYKIRQVTAQENGDPKIKESEYRCKMEMGDLVALSANDKEILKAIKADKEKQQVLIIQNH